MNADNFTAGLFQAHNPASFAGGATSFLDCLMARLLEGGGRELRTVVAGAAPDEGRREAVAVAVREDRRLQPILQLLPGPEEGVTVSRRRNCQQKA